MSKHSDSYDIKSIEQKATQLELKLKTGVEKYEKLKNDHMKLNA